MYRMHCGTTSSVVDDGGSGGNGADGDDCTIPSTMKCSLDAVISQDWPSKKPESKKPERCP